jgi:hypothetical protein
MATETNSESVSEIEIEMPQPGDTGYDEWRKTGKLPEREDSAPPKEEAEEIEAPEAQVEAESPAAEEEAVTRADSAPAKPQGNKKDAAARLQQVLAERRKDRELIEQLTRKLAGQPSDKPESRTAAEPKPEAKTEAKPKPKRPKLADAGQDGKPLYKTYGDFEAAVEKYEDALDEWNRSELLRLIDDRSTKAQQTQQVAEAEKVVMQVWGTRVQAAKKQHADYDAVMRATVDAKDDLGRDLIYLPKGSAPDMFLNESELGSEMLYYIGQHLDDVKHIFERNQEGQFLLNPIKQVRELAKIEALLEQSQAKGAPPKAPARIASAAPKPPHQVSGKAPTTDPLAKAVEEGDQEAYVRLENDKALAKLRERRGRR